MRACVRACVHVCVCVCVFSTLKDTVGAKPEEGLKDKESKIRRQERMEEQRLDGSTKTYIDR